MSSTEDFSDQVELERRLAELWEAVEQRALANPDVRTTGASVSHGRPPAPSGVQLVSNVDTLTFSWNPVSIRNLKRYEVRVAPSSDFTGATIFKTRDTTFTYQDGDPDQTYWVQVRTINTNNAESTWSKTLNTTTGKAFFNHLARGAANSITMTTKTSGFSPSVLDTTGTRTGVYASTTVDLPKDADIIIFAFAKLDFDVFSLDTVFVRVRVNGVTQQEYENGDFAFGTRGVLSVTGLGFPAFVIAGEHTFDFEIEVEDTDGDGSATTITPKELSIAIWEARN